MVLTLIKLTGKDPWGLCWVGEPSLQLGKGPEWHSDITAVGEPGTQVYSYFLTDKGALQHLKVWHNHTQKPYLDVAHLYLIRALPHLTPTSPPPHHPSSPPAQCFTSSNLVCFWVGFLYHCLRFIHTQLGGLWKFPWQGKQQSIMETEEQLGLGDTSIKEVIPLKCPDHRSYKPNPEHTQGQTPGEESTQGAKHSPLIGWRILTVTPCNEHQNIGILEGIAHLWGESKSVLVIFTLMKKEPSN